MEKRWQAILLVLFLSAIGVVGDSALKIAASSANPLKSKWFTIGLIIFAALAFGWVYAMKYIKLSEIGLFYSLGTVSLLCVSGVAFFGETLRPGEILGLVLAIVSFALLGRIG